jgi:hypothetical protein
MQTISPSGSVSMIALIITTCSLEDARSRIRYGTLWFLTEHHWGKLSGTRPDFDRDPEVHGKFDL